MRPYQIFAGMSSEEAIRFCERMRRDSMPTFRQAVAAAAAAMKSRPGFLAKQPLERQANAIRRSLARVAADPVAEELLAVYFLDCRKELLVEWLDALGIAHEEGTLKEDEPAEPDGEALDRVVGEFRSVDDDADRELLLHAFAAQRAIEWPRLDALLERPS